MSGKLKEIIELSKIINHNLNKKYLNNSKIIHILEKLVEDIENNDEMCHKFHLTAKDIKTDELERHFDRSLDLINQHAVQMYSIILTINKMKQFVKRKSQSLQTISSALMDYEKVVEEENDEEDEEQDEDEQEDEQEEQEQEEQEEREQEQEQEQDDDNTTIIISDEDDDNTGWICV